MAPIASLFTSLLLASFGSAHFLLNWPATVGFDDTQEATGPCGSFTVDFTKDNISDFHVGGDTVYLTGTHPTTTFLYRATTDQTASGNWSDLLSGPIQVVGIGDNCQPLVPVPAGFAGSKGVVQIVADSPDGILYQCAAVNFVAGAGPTGGEHGCKNATGVQMNYVALSSDANLAPFASGGSPTMTTTSTAAMSPSATHTSGSSASARVPFGLGAIGAAAWVALSLL